MSKGTRSESGSPPSALPVLPVEWALSPSVLIDDKGKIVAYNPRAEGLFGQRIREMNGQSFATIFAEVDQDEAAALGRRAMTMITADSSLRARNASGITIDVETTGAPLNGPGLEGKSVIIFRDISSLRETERALARRDAQLRQVLSNAPCALWEAQLRPEGGALFERLRIFESPGVRSLLNLGELSDHRAGEAWLKSRVAEDIPKVEDTIRHTIQNGAGGYSVEYRFRDKDGQIRWVRDIAAASLSEAGTWQATGLIIEITEIRQNEERLRRAMEEAEQSNRSKDRFLALVSHELRTPLNPISLAIHAWQSDPNIPDTLREDLAMMRRNIDTEARIIDDLLDLQAITRGKLRIALDHADFHLLLKYAADIVMAADLGTKGVVVKFDFKATDPQIVTDPARMEQALWNLIKNAVKFTPRGGSITIRTRDVGESIEASVSDQGIGIEDEALQRIFDPFEQAESDTSQRFGGLGLGLAIARGIVEVLGGKISARSGGIGQGATFLLTVPRAVEPAP